MTLVIFAVVAVLLVLVAETTARLISSLVSEPLWWHDLFTQRKERQMRALSRAGGVDIVVVGTSLMLLGIDPAVIAERTGLRVYNASIYRGLPVLSEAWLNDRVLPLLRPRLVLTGLMPVELNDNSPLCEQFVLYRGSRALRYGTRHRVLRLLVLHSYALRYAYLVRRPRTLLAGLRQVARRPRSWRWRLPDDIPGVLGRTGEGLDYLDRTYYTGPRLRDLYVQQSANFDDGGGQSAAMLRIQELNARHGARTVYVGMPASREYIETMMEGGRPVWDERWAYWSTLVKERATVLDFHEEFESEEYYADMMHMNRCGRDAYSSRIADALVAVLCAEGIIHAAAS